MHRKHLIVAILASAALLAAVACDSAIGSSFRETERLERSFALEPGGTVAVKNTNGSVQVTASDGDGVVLRATKSARRKDDLDRITIAIDTSPDRLEIETEIPRGARGSVSYDLAVPRGARVEAASVNGSVRILGTAAGTRARTVNGALTISEIAGNLTARTVNGSLRVEWASVAGSTKNTLQTVNGSLKVWLPGDTTGDFEAKTVNGSIRTDLPLEIRKGRWGRRPSINDRIGDGGPTFALSTVNGSISILKN